MPRQVLNRLISVFILMLVIGVLFVFETVVPTPHDGKLRVVFFDVGQGDAIFVESPTGVQVLIDAGDSSDILRALGREMGLFDRRIDMVVATHPDKDHIGGFYSVMDRYDVGAVMRTEKIHDSITASQFYDAVLLETDEIMYARRGMTFDLGSSTVMEVLFPERDASFLENNASSIVLRISYGDTQFLLTGDAPQSVEDHIVVLDREDGVNDLKSDVLKVGHHGSRTSSSELFLRHVDPTYAVVSAGEDDRYGHPHDIVVDGVASVGATLVGTYENGDVTFVSDGIEVVRY
jgi:competence protein ComEC